MRVSRVKSGWRSVWMLRLIVLLTQLPIGTPGRAQSSPYPDDYFSFPIMPGRPNFIVGNMGELRPNHFHSGLDIKTQQREGLPVYASAEGYVSRVKASTSGYGNVIYITHPNGLVTVYAHLRTFNRAIGDYVRQHQYQLRSFEVELLPKPYELPVIRGEVLAFSGNTGSSGGPHLHFEVRDVKENVLNPLHFGFSEIADQVAPSFEKIGFRTLDAEARVNGEFGRVETGVKKINAHTYALAQPVNAYGNVGLEILVYDQASGVPNRNGVTCVELEVDGKEIYSHYLESFAFEQSRHINVHADYATGTRFQRCYLADGNGLTIYKNLVNRGRIYVAPQSSHQVTVTLWDAYRNKSQLSFTLRGKEPAFTMPTLRPPKGPATLHYALDENTLIVKARNITKDAQSATLYMRGKAYQQPMVAYKGNEATYLWDLRRGMPDSVSVCGVPLRLYFRQLIAPQTDVTFGNDSLRIGFEKTSLFDTLYLEVERSGDGVRISNPSIPLLSGISVGIKPVSAGWNQAKTLAYAIKGGRLQCLGGTWLSGQLNFKTRELGTFTLATDSIPPSIQLVTKTPNEIAFRIRDNLSGIASFEAQLNGKWLLMNYDHKRALIWSEKPDPSLPLQGTYTLTVKDVSGNVQVYTTTL